jgi:hypothetical protein
VELARGAVERDAARHADDRFWVLAPSLVVQRRDGRLDYIEVGPHLADAPAGRALARGGLRELLRALDARRAAVALHVDLTVDGDRFPAIVLGVVGALVASFQYAAVERDAAGLPRLGPWVTAPEIADDVATALLRAIDPELR